MAGGWEGEITSSFHILVWLVPMNIHCFIIKKTQSSKVLKNDKVVCAYYRKAVRYTCD